MSVTGILGKKIGMTQLFDDKGEVHPVTVLQAGPCVVTQLKTLAGDGWVASIGARDRAGLGSIARRERISDRTMHKVVELAEPHRRRPIRLRAMTNTAVLNLRYARPYRAGDILMMRDQPREEEGDSGGESADQQ